jgi:hypothetical protein
MPTKTRKKIKSVKRVTDETQVQAILDARERYSLEVIKKAQRN